MTKQLIEQDNISITDNFKELVKGVSPLKNDRIDLYAHKKNSRPFHDNSDYSETDSSVYISDELEVQNVSGEEFIFFARTGVQLKFQKQLRQGKITIEDHLDLHGLTIVEARQTLLEFISFAQKQQLRCIRLVHGKGYRSHSEQPVLKNKVNSWLRQHTDIIAFSSAQAQDGGTGALYIVIKKI